jgi:ATP adenylyltransferase
VEDADVDRLWAVWRMKYIEEMKDRRRHGLEEDEASCFFCAGVRCEDGPGNLVLCRDAWAMIMLNMYPYNPGHLMVAPLRHVASPRGLTSEESRAMMEFLGRAEALLSGAFEPDGFNVGINLGRCAGAGVPGHLHMHVVPRWNGDTNFMPVTGETKVMVESLAETYARLARLLGGGASDGGDTR